MSSKSSSNPPLKSVGWVKDAHGLRGEFYVQLFAKTADWLDSLEKIYFQFEGRGDTAFVVARAKPFKDGLILAVEGISDRTAAEAWRKAQVLIPADLLVSEAGDQLFLNQLMDFAVLDGGVKIGFVRGFSSNGAQDLLQVALDAGGEALVPLVDAFIEEIDMEKRELRMSLPPGLIE